MIRGVRFGIAYLIPACAAVGLWLGGAWTFLTVAFVFVLTPALDAVLGLEESEPDREGVSRSFPHDVWLWAWLPMQLVLIGLALTQLASGGLSGFELAGLVLSIGIVTGGGGITIAHELMHRPGRFERALAELLMSCTSYTHFCIEHVLGHHRYVATRLDPATAHKGELVYPFVLRSVFGGARSAWRLEAERVQRLGISPYSLRDRRFRYFLENALIYGLVFSFFGVGGILFFAAQSAVAICLLETINYVEHYGLEREELEPGRFERVRPEHSWNSAHRLTGWYLFKLPRHADHHYLASRPYFSLRHFPESPQLPAGYSTMVLVALVPPLWRKVMDPRVAALSRAA